MGRFDNRAENGMFNYAPETKDTGALSAYRDGTQVTKVVRVLNLLFFNQETGYRVLQVEEDDRLFVMKGYFPSEINLNGYYQVEGKVWTRNGEKQLDVASYKTAVPTDKEGIINVLKTLHGLDTRAYKLYSICGPTVIEQIMKAPDSVARKMKGLGFGAKAVRDWQAQLLSGAEAEEATRILLGYGIKAAKAKKLLDAHGPGIAEKIKKNPYLLLEHMDGLTFFECDEIALKDGYALDGIDRVQEAVKYGLRCITSGEGHTCATKGEFVQACRYYVSHPLSITDAKRILQEAETKNESRSLIYMLGNNRVEIDVQELKAAVRSNRAKKSFAFPLYRCPNEVLSNAVNGLLTKGTIVRERIGEVSYYRLADYALYERKISEMFGRLERGKGEQFSVAKVEDALDAVIRDRSRLRGQSIVLEPKQREAVKTICTTLGGAFVLTGPAGSGKTFVLGIIIDVMRKLCRQDRRAYATQVLAPTGKAAKVAERATGIPASTIHRFIGKVSDGSSVQSTADAFVVDEFSMVDEELFAGLAERIPSSAKLIIMGDIEQLASIGPGACLRDLILSSAIPCVKLDVVKRQAGNSGILVNANRIISGQMIGTERVNQNGDKDNAYFIPEDDPVIARDKIVALVKRAGLRRLQGEVLQVLCPRKRGETGTYVMNYIIQQELNPYHPGPDSLNGESDRVPLPIEIEYTDNSGRSYNDFLYFQVNDRVIHIKNNYEMEWYRKTPLGDFAPSGRVGIMNGETGVIERIYLAQVGTSLVQRIVVRYGDDYVYYDGDAKSELMLAYAMTIHKAQGSQWPIVLCPLLSGDYMMLNRQLLYTMITRAEETFFLIGSKRAVEHGIRNIDAKERRTLLRECLTGAI